MSNDQHEMYAENVNEDQNSSSHVNLPDNQLENTGLTSPQTQISGSKRKRDSAEDSQSVEEPAQERRASLKRAANANALGPNSSFMAVNQSPVPPTAPMAFQNVAQSQQPESVNGAPQDPSGMSTQIHLAPQMTVPQPTTMAFAPEGTVRVGDPIDPQTYNTIPQPTPQQQQQQAQQQQPPQAQMQPQAAMVATSGNAGHHGHGAPHAASHGAPHAASHGAPHAAPTTPAPKPAVGTEEWHKVRRDNHKEVERRRRETINEGINELAKIVPGCEKNKGSILQRAVQFIQELKEHEATNIEKWTLEKLLTEQAIAELTATNEKLKAECERAWREAETWKKSCLAAESSRLAAESNRNVESTSSS